LHKIRAGRITLKIFDSILVECYQKFINLNQLSSIVIINNNAVKITPWDKNNMQSINKAIINSDLGVNPNIIDNAIKLNFPPMTQERRLDLIKSIKKTGENTKINIRNIRRDNNTIVKKLLKEKEITKDEEKLVQDKIQIITDRFILEVNKCYTIRYTPSF
jgi:ribosome recycling factor